MRILQFIYFGRAARALAERLFVLILAGCLLIPGGVEAAFYFRDDRTLAEVWEEEPLLPNIFREVDA